MAVKEFKRHVPKTDAVREAEMLSKLNHPGLPVILGVDLTTCPWLIVSLFYRINQRNTTLFAMLNSANNEFGLGKFDGLSIILQLSNALKYLHDHKVLHNDIKTDNVMITKDPLHFKPTLIDFGKACSFTDAKSKQLSQESKIVYRTRHAHIAPEIVDGISKQSAASDIYALGRVILKVGDFCKCDDAIQLISFILEECEILQNKLLNSASGRRTLHDISTTSKRTLSIYVCHTLTS